MRKFLHAKGRSRVLGREGEIAAEGGEGEMLVDEKRVFACLGRKEKRKLFLPFPPSPPPPRQTFSSSPLPWHSFSLMPFVATGEAARTKAPPPPPFPPPTTTTTPLSTPFRRPPEEGGGGGRRGKVVLCWSKEARGPRIQQHSKPNEVI